MRQGIYFVLTLIVSSVFMAPSGSTAKRIRSCQCWRRFGRRMVRQFSGLLHCSSGLASIKGVWRWLQCQSSIDLRARQILFGPTNSSLAVSTTSPNVTGSARSRRHVLRPFNYFP